MMTRTFIYGVAFTVLALGLFPFFHYLIFGLSERRREILSYFSDSSIRLYFKQFYSAEAPKLSQNPRLALCDMYNARFGVRTFLLPGALYVTSLVLIISIVMCTLLDKDLGWSGPKLESRGLYALAGAYFWVTWDLISHYRQRDMVPSFLYGYAFRFVVSIPLAYGVSTFFNDAAAPPVAFALGAFPTTTLMMIVRRQGAQRFGLGDDIGKANSELEVLQGVNTTLAEKFSDIGVTAMLQLAYEDPIQLAMRTNLSINYITDTISQAMATIYGLDLNVTRPLSIRGALEAAETFDDLTSNNAKDRGRAKIVVDQLAKATGKQAKIVEKILQDITNDPYTIFLRDVWA